MSDQHRLQSDERSTNHQTMRITTSVCCCGGVREIRTYFKRCFLQLHLEIFSKENHLWPIEVATVQCMSTSSKIFNATHTWDNQIIWKWSDFFSFWANQYFEERTFADDQGRLTNIRRFANEMILSIDILERFSSAIYSIRSFKVRIPTDLKIMEKMRRWSEEMEGLRFAVNNWIIFNEFLVTTSNEELLSVKTDHHCC